MTNSSSLEVVSVTEHTLLQPLAPALLHCMSEFMGRNGSQLLVDGGAQDIQILEAPPPHVPFEVGEEEEV